MLLQPRCFAPVKSCDGVAHLWLPHSLLFPPLVGSALVLSALQACPPAVKEELESSRKHAALPAQGFLRQYTLS